MPWLWKGRLFLGGITMIAGQPGLGKSYLTLAVAARITQGRDLPLDEVDEDYARFKASGALIVSAEDHIQYTLKPRIDALQADDRRVAFYDGAAPLQELIIDLEAELLNKQMRYKLLVIDPINAYLGGVNTFRDSDYRAAVAPLVKMVERTNVACILVSHFTKDLKGKALINAVQGSIGAIAAPRVYLGVVAQEDIDGTIERGLVPVKVNIAAPPPSVRFEIDEYGDFHWRGESNLTKEHFEPQLRTRTERTDEKVAWLKEALAAGPVPSRKLHRLAAEERGWSKSSLETAKSHCARYDELEDEW